MLFNCLSVISDSFASTFLYSLSLLLSFFSDFFETDTSSEDFAPTHFQSTLSLFFTQQLNNFFFLLGFASMFSLGSPGKK